LYCTWCAEIIEEVKLASLSLGEESKTKKKEKGGKRELIFCLYLFMVAVLVVRDLLDLLLELLGFESILHHCCRLAVDLRADYRHCLCMMPIVLVLLQLGLDWLVTRLALLLKVLQPWQQVLRMLLCVCSCQSLTSYYL
jgi:hypothetical protein